MTLSQLIGRFAWRHRREYVSAAVMLVLIAVLTVWVPRRVGQMIDGLVAGTLAGAALWQELAILIAMGIAIYLFRVGWRLQLFAAAFRLGVELRTRLYERLALQGLPFFNRQRTGDLMARATNDVDAVEMAAGEAFLAGFDGTLTLVLVVAMMTLGVDWRLGLVALLPFPFMAWAFWVISRHVHEAWRDSLERFSNLNEHVQETVAAVRTLRALGLETRAAADFAARAKGAADASFDAQRWEARYEPAVGLTLTAAGALTLAVGGWSVWSGRMTVGDLTAFTMYLGQLIWPMFAAGWVLSLIERGKAAWARLDPLLREPLSVDDHGTRSVAPAGPIVCASVSFAYPRVADASAGHARTDALTDVSLTLRARPDARHRRTHRRREVDVAASAAAPLRTARRHASPGTGCRSTIIGSPRCARRSHGCRRSRSCSRRRSPPTSRSRAPTRRAPKWRRPRASPTCTPTSSAFRTATTRAWANAASRCPAASGSAWRSPARCCRTRRCCCSTTRLSAVDTGTETRILAHLRAARRGRSAIIVSHRLSAVADADHIVVLKEGRVVEEGAHPALVARDGWYAAQWRYQQLEASLEDA